MNKLKLNHQYLTKAVKASMGLQASNTPVDDEARSGFISTPLV